MPSSASRASRRWYLSKAAASTRSASLRSSCSTLRSSLSARTRRSSRPVLGHQRQLLLRLHLRLVRHPRQSRRAVWPAAGRTRFRRPSRVCIARSRAGQEALQQADAVQLVVAPAAVQRVKARAGQARRRNAPPAWLAGRRNRCTVALAELAADLVLDVLLEAAHEQALDFLGGVVGRCRRWPSDRACSSGWRSSRAGRCAASPRSGSSCRRCAPAGRPGGCVGCRRWPRCGTRR